jgi:hypothetical protein
MIVLGGIRNKTQIINRYYLNLMLLLNKRQKFIVLNRTQVFIASGTRQSFIDQPVFVL